MSELQEALVNYRVSETVMRVTPPEHQLHAQAEILFNAVCDLEWHYPVRCMMCKETFDLRVTTREVAEWCDIPRGLCETCSSGVTAEVVRKMDRQKKRDERKAP